VPARTLASGKRTPETGTVVLMRMRLFAVVVAVLALATSCTMWSEKKHVTWHHASGGEQLERLFWESVEHKEWQALEAHLSITFTTVTNGRTLDHAATLEYLKSIELRSFTLSEVTVTPNGNTMTVAYLFVSKNGPRARMMTVWQRQKSGWVAIAHAETPLAVAQ
jgi:Domain of unknown function (DUF4440)